MKKKKHENVNLECVAEMSRHFLKLEFRMQIRIITRVFTRVITRLASPTRLASRVAEVRHPYTASGLTRPQLQTLMLPLAVEWRVGTLTCRSLLSIYFMVEISL